MKEVYGIQSGPSFRTMTLQGEGGTRRTIEHAHAMIKEMLPHANAFAAPAGLGRRDQPGAAVRRLGRLFRHHRQPGAGPLRRPAGPQRRHGDPVRDARDLRCRAPAHPPRGQPRHRRQAGRADPLVGGILRAQRRRDEQQPVARQQGRRAHHHPREVAGGGRQGRHHQPDGRLQIRRADHREGLRLHGQPRLRPGLGHGPGGLAAATSSRSPPAAAPASASSRPRR